MPQKLLIADCRVITHSYKTVKVWRDGACEFTKQIHDNYITGLAALPGGARFVSGSYDNTAKLWALDGAVERTFELGKNVLCVTALPDGAHFVVGLFKEARLYHVDGTLVYTFTGHTDMVKAVAVTPDGEYIISGSNDRLIKVWNVATGILVSTCKGHTGGVEAVSAMPDGQRIISGGGDNAIRVWRITVMTAKSMLFNTTKLCHTVKCEKTFILHPNCYVTALVALPDNQHALSGSTDNTVKLFNVDDGAVLRTFRQHTSAVYRLALLADGLRFVSVSHGSDSTARVAYHGLAA